MSFPPQAHVIGQGRVLPTAIMEEMEKEWKAPTRERPGQAAFSWVGIGMGLVLSTAYKPSRYFIEKGTKSSQRVKGP